MSASTSRSIRAPRCSSRKNSGTPWSMASSICRLFPLDYASGKVPAFGATLMPGLIRSHDRAKRINNSPFMKEIRAEIEKTGVIVLSDAWLAGARGLQERLHPQARRHEGPQAPLRRRRPLPRCGRPPAPRSSARRRTKSTTRSRPASSTSPTPACGSFQSMRLYEVTDCLTAPGDNALWFMYEPVLMSKKSFNKLNKKQQDALIAAGKKAAGLLRRQGRRRERRSDQGLQGPQGRRSSR